jgi:hypothetical protein
MFTNAVAKNIANANKIRKDKKAAETVAQPAAAQTEKTHPASEKKPAESKA